MSVLILLASVAPAQPAAEVLLVRSPDASPGNWGQLPALLAAQTLIEVREDGRLPEGDLARYKLIALTTNLDVYERERRRLWEYVNTGGKLVIWFADDRRADAIFFPFRLLLGDTDPPVVTFSTHEHPLLRGLSGRSFSGQQCGGDVVKAWDRQRWRVLADTPAGPAMLLADYGQGTFLVVQFHAPLSSRGEVMEPLARNLLAWAGVPALDPAALTQRTIAQTIVAVARRQMRPIAEGEWRRGTWEQVQASRQPTGLAWSYPRGVTLYGLLRAGEALSDQALTEYVLRHNQIVARQWDYLQWQRRTFGQMTGSAGIGELMRLSSLDDCGSMASQVVEGLLVQRARAGPEMAAMLAQIAEYISLRQSRLPDGSLCRGRTLWVDDLYMSCPFLARWATYTGERRYLDDAARQVLQFASRLQDSDGLWFHGWFDREGKTSGWKWGRGNGWAILSEVEVLSQMPQDHPERDRLLGVLRHHIEGLKRVQAPSGLWRQVLDEPDLWEETSCSGMFAYAIARAAIRGWTARGDLEIARRAFEGLKARVAWDGTVLGTCAGTGISRRLEDYRARPRPINDPHGPGPILLAGAELLAPAAAGVE